MTAAPFARAILGIDTATVDVAVASTRAGEAIFDASVPAAENRPRHSVALLEQVGEAVGAAGGWDEIELIAVGLGPGAFTGLRVGVATARALAQARSLPICGVGSLAALAAGIEGEAGRPRLAALDARRGEVFAALYDAGGAELWEPFVVSPGELASRVAGLHPAPLAAGDGSLRFREELEVAGVEIPAATDPAHRIAARHVCALAETAPRLSPEQTKPIYLRRPDAEVWRERQRKGSAAG